MYGRIDKELNKESNEKTNERIDGRENEGKGSRTE